MGRFARLSVGVGLAALAACDDGSPGGAPRRIDGGATVTLRDGGVGRVREADAAAPAPDGGPIDNPNAVEDTAAWLFEPASLRTVRLQITVAPGFRTWKEMLLSQYDQKLAVYCDPTMHAPWAHASVEIDEPDGRVRETRADVGVRWRGASPSAQWAVLAPDGSVTTTDGKHGFKIDLRKFGGRRIAGVDTLDFINQEGDASLVKECLGYTVARLYGSPAPRCNHVRLFVNGGDEGVFENVEEPTDQRYLRHRFDDAQGGLYEVHKNECHPDVRLDYLGALPADYLRLYELHAGTTEMDLAARLIPMLRCGDAVQTPDDAAFRACIEGFIDVPQWLRMVAVEQVMPNYQNFGGGSRKFLLYDNPGPMQDGMLGGGRFQVWSWDYDGAFDPPSPETMVGCRPDAGGLYCSVLGAHYVQMPMAKLVNRLMRVYRADYCAAVRGFAAGPYAADSIARLVGAMHDAMAPGMAGDPYVTPDAWAAAVADIQRRIGRRRDMVTAHLPECATEPIVSPEPVTGP